MTAGPAGGDAELHPGVGGSWEVRDKPPSAHRSMPAIAMPRRRATRAWPSSCRISEAKNDSTEATATR